MREFSTQITEALRLGIKPKRRSNASTHLENLKGFLPFELGVRGWVPFDSFFPPLPDNQYPFPQVLHLEKGTVIIESNNVVQAETGFVPANLKQIELKNWFDFRLTEFFTFVSFEEKFFAVSPEGSLWGTPQSVSASVDLRANAMLKNRTRTLLGGLQSPLWNSTWLQWMENWVKVDLPQEFGGNVLVWSSYESLDIPFGLMEPNEFFSQMSVGEWVETNEWGFMPMIWSGDILDLQLLGDRVFVGGEDGCSIVQEQSEAPGATYGVVADFMFGLRSRGSSGSDGDSVLLIDSDNQLRLISSEGSRMFGFQEEMSELGAGIRIRKHPSEDIWFIGDGFVSFALVEGKLTRINQTVDYIVEAFPEMAHAFETSENTGIVQTQKVDIGIAGLKTITGITINSDEDIIGNASVSVSSSVAGKRNSSRVFGFNYEGYSPCRMFGRNLIITINFKDASEIALHNIEVKWQVDDSRARRGIHATQDVTGTDI